MTKPKQTVSRSKTVFPAALRRPWNQLPPDSFVSTWVIARIAGCNPRTVQRHQQRGLLPPGNSIQKAKVEQWLKGVEGRISPGRPSKVRFRNARQRVLPGI